MMDADRKIRVLSTPCFDIKMDAAKQVVGREANLWIKGVRQALLRHNHPCLNPAIGAEFVRINAAPLAFLARLNLALLLRRDIVIAAVNQVISKGNAHVSTPLPWL